MKKCTFYRTVGNHNNGKLEAVKANGFCQTVKDYVAHEITICFYHESKNLWYAIEKTTGLKVCEAETKQKAFDMLMDKYIDDIYELICDDFTPHRKFVELIRRAYEKES